MAKVTQKYIDEQLEILKNDGIPKDLIEKIRDKIKDEELEEVQLEYLFNKIISIGTNQMHIMTWHIAAFTPTETTSKHWFCKTLGAAHSSTHMTEVMGINTF